ncbi:sensor histidine kinase [Actinopolymorpha alba]|uniref:sensor histidine kinase n=1 Tax=Actinopolymorpha alba TaxID=533267 RepID=UPI000372BE99|nr:HAMP domain-containing sensor histidine kinase [Actinopolymorpha alba]
MTRPSTLRGRLALVGLLTVTMWVAILTVAFNYGLGHQLRSQADDLLRTRAEAAQATIDIRSDGTLGVREAPNDTALDTGIWIFEGPRLLEPDASRTTTPQRLVESLANRGERFQDSQGPGATRMYALPLRLGHRQVGTVVAAVDLDPYQRTARIALIGSAALAGLLLAGVYVVARLTVKRTLAPVYRMAHQAAEWSAQDVTQRFGTAGRPAELEDLARSLDGLLDRLSAVLRHEQQLSAELSHELRTPLARITAETELLLCRPRSRDELQSAHVSIRDSAERMGQIIETLLVSARAEAVTPPGSCIVAEVLAAMVEQRQVGGVPSIELSGVDSGPLECGVSADILERVLSPVLDNAVRHAHREVHLSVRRAESAVEILIEDDGPGLADQVAEAAFTPGWRHDPDDGHDGAGLGLPLARRLARSAGGDVHHVSTASGATFAILLPAASSEMRLA